ncbi:MAG: IclR family transcriptional regulator [Streptosporangiaceae bacterium]
MDVTAAGELASRPAAAVRRAAAGTQSVQRALLLLDQFTADQPTRTVDQLSLLSGVPRSTVYRLLALLRAHELVEQAGENRYQLGPRAITMGYVARLRTDVADIWRPALVALAAATSETALVMRRVGNSAVCVDRVECDHPVRLSFEVGRTMPLHAGAGAKVILAYSPDDLRQRYVEHALPAPARGRLTAELARIRDQGWADSSAEVDQGIWAVAAPVSGGHDRLHAISVALPEYRLDLERRETLRAAVLDAAAALRANLVYYG